MSSRRLPWLLLMLAATAALGAFGEPEPSGAKVPATPRLQERGASIRALLPRGAAPWPGGDPFAVAAPAPAPVVMPEAADAAKPVPLAPAPAPWRVIGKQQDEDASWTVFLARGEDTWVVREGDALDDGFRVAAIKPPTLTLQHARHNTRRTIDIGIARE